MLVPVRFRMRKPSNIAVLLVAALGLSAAQTRQESWDNLRQLRSGEDIEIVDAQMKSHRGRFTRYTQDAITLRHESRDISVARAEVASVKRRGESHRRRNALIGLAIGAAGGLAVGAIRGKTYHEQGETPVFIMVWTPIGAGIGAAVGAALPSGGEVTAYRASAVARR
jgi:hypothetical protein